MQSYQRFYTCLLAFLRIVFVCNGVSKFYSSQAVIHAPILPFFFIQQAIGSSLIWYRKVKKIHCIMRKVIYSMQSFKTLIPLPFLIIMQSDFSFLFSTTMCSCCLRDLYVHFHFFYLVPQYVSLNELMLQTLCKFHHPIHQHTNLHLVEHHHLIKPKLHRVKQYMMKIPTPQ